MERANAWELLREYNKDHFHLQHALTVEAVMRWFANDLGYGAEADYWGMVGLLHDIDFELYPEQHCVKCVELLEKWLGKKASKLVCSVLLPYGRSRRKLLQHAPHR